MKSFFNVLFVLWMIFLSVLTFLTSAAILLGLVYLTEYPKKALVLLQFIPVPVSMLFFLSLYVLIKGWLKHNLNGYIEYFLNKYFDCYKYSTVLVYSEIHIIITSTIVVESGSIYHTLLGLLVSGVIWVPCSKIIAKCTDYICMIKNSQNEIQNEIQK
jgi:hypothetical protein